MHSLLKHRVRHGRLSAFAFAIIGCVLGSYPAQAQLIQSVAGTGTAGYSNDGGLAANAQVNDPFGVAVDPAGNIYIADTANHRVRVVNTGTSAITVANVTIQPQNIATVAGNGTAGFSGDNGPATSAQLYNPIGVVADGAGNIYIADLYNYRVRKVNSSGIITTFVGTGSSSFGGDNGPAAAASLYPWALAVDPAGNLYIADTGHNRIRAVNTGASTITVANVTIQPGFIATVAGNGNSGGLSNGPALSATFDIPYGVAVDNQGNIYICDTYNRSIRVVNAGTIAIRVANITIAPGNIATVAGDGQYGYVGDGGPGTSARFADPAGVAVDNAGNIYVSDLEGERIRLVNARNGLTLTVAGTTTYGYNGENIPATTAQLSYPRAIDIDPAGNIIIADQPNERIRRVAVNTLTRAITSSSAAGLMESNSSSFVVTTNYWPTPQLSVAGPLPNGVTFVDNGNGTATLGGIPAAGTAGNYNLTITASNSVLADVTQNLTLTVYVAGGFPATSSASFVSRDTSTSGNWQAVYGSDGYSISNSGYQTIPAYATFAVQNQLNYVWDPNPPDARALKIPGSSARIASTWFTPDSYSFDVNVGNSAHQIALYALDWDYRGRLQTIQIQDASSGFALDTQAAFGFGGGTYYKWNVTGHVRIVITAVGGPNAVISGVFFEPTTGGSGGPGSPTSFVTSRTLGTIRNDYSGLVGARIQIGANPVTVDTLGRMVAPGNSASHTLKLVNASTGSDVPGGAVSVATAGATAGTFVYGPLASPVTLSANAIYYLLSAETLGGDQWYDNNTTVQTTDVATVVGSVYGTGPPFAANGSAGRSYVPVDFQYGQTTSGPPEITLQPQSASVTVSQSATFSVNASGIGLSYQWESQLSGASSFQSIPGANGSSYVTPATQLSDSGTQFRCVVTDSAGSVTSTAATLTVLPAGAPTITAQPQNATVAYGQPASFSIGATGIGLTYQWQSQPPGASGFAPIGGATGSTYITGATQSSDTGTLFRCVVSNTGGPVTSDAASLTVQPPPAPVITQQPQNATVGAGQTATFSVAASGVAPTYLWQFKKPADVAFSDIPSATASTYITPVTQASDDGTQFRCVVSNSGGPATSNVASLQVLPAGSTAFVTSKVLGTRRNDFTGWVGMVIQVGSNPISVNALGRIVATGNSASHPVKIVDSTGADLAGASVSVPTAGGTPGSFAYGSLPSPVTLQPNSVYYVVSLETLGGDAWFDHDSTVTTTSAAVVLQSVYGSGSTFVKVGTPGQSYVPVDLQYGGVVTGRPEITQQPQNATVTVGQTATFSVSATGAGLTYQWQSQAAGAGVFSDIPGAQSNSYTTPLSQLGDNGTQFHCVITNGFGSATSAAATLTVQPPGVGTPYVTSLVLGALRNDYTGWVGLTITTRNAPVTITALGRIFVSGNSGSHSLKIVNAANGADVAGGAVTVAMSGGTPGAFLYANLASPVVLNPNTAYYVLSQESAGGDRWYDYATTTAATSWVASPTGAVYGTGAPYVVVPNSAGHQYVPVDFKYTVPPTAYITSKTLGTLRNNFTGWVGMQFTLGNSALTVSSLGRIAVSGNTGSHTVKLVASNGVDVPGGSVTVNTAGATAGAFVYAALASPVTLSANTTYRIVSAETGGGDLWYDYDTTLQTSPVGPIIGALYGVGSTYTLVSNSPARSYVPVDFLFQ